MDEHKVENQQDQTSEKKNYIHIKRLPLALLLLLTVFVTAGITTLAFAFGNEKSASPIMSDERSEFEKLYETYDTLKKGYYEDIDQDQLVNGAINGMIDSLEDPYSDYMNQEEAKGFKQSISSSFEGIGAEIQEKDGHIVIVSPLKGSPAEKAGIKPNDIVLSVDGKSLQGMSSTEAVMLIRGKKGTKVELSIQRAGAAEVLKVPIIRDEIPLETVYGEMVDDKIAKVQITTFSTNTSKELIDVLNDLQKKGMKGLVLDLRQNPGGLLEQAVEISSLFVPKGEILFKVEDRNGNSKEYPSKNEGNPDLPLVVLIDKGSASASEILAAAVKESANVKLVGEKSFGKGTVQTAQEFSDGSNIKFTTAKWLTPKGNWIHKKGIKPDFEVALPSYANLPFLNPEKELKVSDSSNEVKTAEEMLSAIGYSTGNQDGFYDEATKKAVLAFQKDNSLTQTGVLKGQSTLKLMDLIREKLQKNDTQMLKAIEEVKKITK